MSRSYSAPKNENQKQSKADFHSYFYNNHELEELISAELEAKLLESSRPLRQEFRRLARRMRARNV